MALTQHRKPLLLVDFDGVINVIRSDDRKEELEAEFKRDGHRIRVPAGTSQRFARLVAAFECVWATTWGQEAPILGRFLGFGANWSAIFIGSGGRLGATGKLPEVRRWCESHAVGRPVAWVDDDLWPDVHDWAMARGQTLIVRTLPDEGLTDAQTEVPSGEASRSREAQGTPDPSGGSYRSSDRRRTEPGGTRR
jgi:hypothetical protein